MSILDGAKKEIRSMIYDIVEESKLRIKRELNSVSKEAVEDLKKELNALRCTASKLSIDHGQQILEVKNTIKRGKHEILGVSSDVKGIFDSFKERVEDLDLTASRVLEDTHDQVRIKMDELSVEISSRIKNNEDKWIRKVNDLKSQLTAKADGAIEEGITKFDSYVKNYIQNNAGELLILMIKSLVGIGKNTQRQPKAGDTNA